MAATIDDGMMMDSSIGGGTDRKSFPTHQEEDSSERILTMVKTSMERTKTALERRFFGGIFEVFQVFRKFSTTKKVEKVEKRKIIRE